MGSSYILVIILVAVLAGGLVYMTRPWLETDIVASVPLPPSPTPIDNTEPWPPRPSGIEFDQVRDLVRVTLKTSQGDIVLLLDGPRAPWTVGNFVYLAENDFYDGTSFHRVIPDFMIQGGDPLSRDQSQRGRHGMGGPAYKFQDEINEHKIVRGAVAMANSGPNTNGSQFFIVTAAELPHLDGKHTVFGVVEEGMDVVDAISLTKTDELDNPIEPIIIEDVLVHGELGEGLEVSD